MEGNTPPPCICTLDPRLALRPGSPIQSPEEPQPEGPIERRLVFKKGPKINDL
ncbi:MAG: hypothetical protein CM15mP3_10330 [Candidatus Poseidoniales archaeon]|nr:MAG: hypothetical protein CM15mP3_10330 [Candidatus Poseidoniales archaeon]